MSDRSLPAQIEAYNRRMSKLADDLERHAAECERCAEHDYEVCAIGSRMEGEITRGLTMRKEAVDVFNNTDVARLCHLSTRYTHNP